MDRLPRLHGQSPKALLARSQIVSKLSETLRDVMPLVDLVRAQLLVVGGKPKHSKTSIAKRNAVAAGHSSNRIRFDVIHQIHQKSGSAKQIYFFMFCSPPAGGRGVHV